MSLDEVFDISVVRVFMIEDHGNCLVGEGYDFGHVYSSGVACSFFIFFDSLLGIAHF